MSVQNGQPVNAQINNASNMSRLTDTSTIGKVDINNTTQSTGPTDGSLHTQGGAGIEKNLYVGDTLDVANSATITNDLTVFGISTLGTVMADSVTATGGITGLDVTATDQLIGNSLQVNQAATVGTTLGVTGATTLSTVSTSGAATLNSAAVTNNQTVGGALGVTGNTSLSTVSSSGLATLNSAQVTNNATVGGSLIVTGNTTLNGNLTVNGTTTTIGAANLVVTDKNIIVNNGGNDATSEGAGLTVDRTGTDGSLIYKDTSASKFAAGPLGSEVDLVNLSGAQVLTNKTISGATNTLSNLPAASITGTLPIANGGTGQTTASAAFDVLSPGTTKGDLIVHNGTTEVRLGVGANGTVPIADSSQATGIRWGPGGSGSGGGAVNFITNGGSDDGTSIWVPYNDRIGNPTTDRRPIDGSGGSPTVSQSIVGGGLSGDWAVFLTKPAGDCQGQGWSTGNITIPQEFRAKPLSHYLAYLVQSGTFVAGANGTSPVDGDLIVQFWDVTQGKIVESSNIKFFASSTTVVDAQTGNIQLDLACTTVRIILHIASQSTAAWTLKIDSALLSPVLSNYASIRGPVGSIIATGSITPPVGYLYANGSAVSRAQYSELFTAIGTTYGVGDGSTTFNIPDARGIFLSGAGTQTISSISYSKTLGAKQNDQMQGHHHVYRRSAAQTLTNSDTGQLAPANPNLAGTGSGILDPVTDGVNGTPRTGSETRPANIAVAYHICFSSGDVKLSEPGDGRSAVFTGFIPGAQALTANVTNINLTAEKDTHGGWTGSTYVIQVSDDYEFSFMGVNSIGGGTVMIYVNGTHRKNIVTLNTSEFRSGTVKIANLLVGQTVSFRQDASVTVTGSTTASAVSISRVGGSQAIGAGEKIRARYSCTTGPTINNSAPIVTYNAQGYDTHGIYVSGSMRPPRAGFYTFRSSFQTISHATTSNFLTGVFLYVNGSVVTYISNLIAETANTVRRSAQGTTGFYLLSTDVVTFRVYSDQSTALSTVGEANWIEIEG